MADVWYIVWSKKTDFSTQLLSLQCHNVFLVQNNVFSWILSSHFWVPKKIGRPASLKIEYLHLILAYWESYVESNIMKIGSNPLSWILLGRHYLLLKCRSSRPKCSICIVVHVKYVSGYSSLDVSSKWVAKIYIKKIGLA